MGLRDLNIQPEYRTNTCDIVKEFLVPVLSEAVTYDRAVGFFSSSALAEVAKGIGRIAQRGGRIRLIASPNLSDEDINPEDCLRRPMNHSKGCGGIMRVAPLGLVRKMYVNEESNDREGAILAAITHGHSLGYMPAAVLVHQRQTTFCRP